MAKNRTGIRMFIRHILFCLFFFCFFFTPSSPLYAQPKTLPANFPTKIWTDWKNASSISEYQKVLAELEPYRNVKNRIVNYMFGYTACRLSPDCPFNGLAYLKNATKYSNIPPDFNEKVNRQIEACGGNNQTPVKETNEDLDFEIGGSDHHIGSVTGNIKGGGYYNLPSRDKHPSRSEQLRGYSVDKMLDHRFLKSADSQAILTYSEKNNYWVSIGTDFLVFFSRKRSPDSAGSIVETQDQLPPPSEQRAQPPQPQEQRQIRTYQQGQEAERVRYITPVLTRGYLDSTFTQIREQWAYLSGIFPIAADSAIYYKAIYFAEGPKNVNKLICKKDRIALPYNPAGFTNPLDYSIVYDERSGVGTRAHELTHLFLDIYFPDAPAWFNEGLPCLFEQSSINTDKNGKVVSITGYDNWRKKFVLADTDLNNYPRKELGLGQLLQMDNKTFNCADTLNEFQQAINFAFARYLLLYIQDKKALPDLCRTLYGLDVEEKFKSDTLYGDLFLKLCHFQTMTELEHDFLEWFTKRYSPYGNPFKGSGARP